MKPIKNYFINQYLNNTYNHGGIGYVDIEKQLVQLNFNSIELNVKSNSIVGRIFSMISLFLKIENKATVVFIHPMYATMYKILAKLLVVFKQINLISIVGDIDGLRDKNETLLKEEIFLFKKCNKLIVHNQSMELWFKNIFPNKEYFQLEFFDFITAEKNSLNKKNSSTIVYAGNFQKAKFIESLNKLITTNSKLKFNLYGKNIFNNSFLQPNLNFKGEFTPYDTLKNIDGSFGLIWDGDSLESCSGVFGDYLKYNTQHKLSLYILAGVPIITWDQSAIASTINQYNIGFCVSSIYEIEEKINSLSENDYQLMIENMKPIAEKIRTGFYLQSAIKSIAL